MDNHRELADRHQLELKSDCDSEIILRLVERAAHPVIGLRWALRECSGSMAVSVYDARRHVVFLARNAGRPLWLARLRNDRRWFLASTREILLKAFKRIIGGGACEQLKVLVPLAEDVVHVLTLDGVLLAT